MNSREYWKEREAENLAKNLKSEEAYAKTLQGYYDYMMDQVQKEISGFYVKYANKEGITMAEAKKRVSKLDIAEYGRKAAKYVKDKDLSAQANEEMRLYNATMKINRLEMLKANIGLEMVVGFDELQKFFDTVLTDRTLSEFERQAGILGNTIQNNAQMAHAIVNASFNNARYSDRVWMYQSMMKSELSKLLQIGLIQGKNPRELARHLTKLFGVQKSNAERLMRTELARVQTEAQRQSFERNGYEQYEFIALGNACDVCRAINGKHFDVKKMMPGENAPPMHPNCRCSTSAYMDREEFDKWLESQDDRNIAESDIGKEIPDMLSGLTRQKKEFKNGLEIVSNSDVKRALKQAMERVTIKRSKGRRSSYSAKEGIVYLAKSAEPDTLAHELFHEIDTTHRLTRNGGLKKSVQSDYRRLQNLSNGYGKSIEEMLYSRYKDAFVPDEDGITLHKEYRGISDIINGMSEGSINMGFWHDSDYWKKSGKVEAETFAQIGRTLYGNNQQVLNMMKDVFPDSYSELMKSLKGLMK